MPQALLCGAWAVTVFVSCLVPCVCSEFWCASLRAFERVSVDIGCVLCIALWVVSAGAAC